MLFPLFEFAFIPDMNTRLGELADMAMPENWNYRHTNSLQPHPILYNYLHHTFMRLKDENKICEIQNWACFNTGLVTENQEEIFALFELNKKTETTTKWFFQQFCRESDRNLLRFGRLPSIANYFEDPAELLYDTRLDLRKNLDHIIDKNQDRFPAPFNDASNSDSKHQLRIALDGAIDHAIKRIKRNYKTAVPQFYENTIQLLMPLCFRSNVRADLALVVYKQGNVYLASTCLTLDMAYNNARLIARPDNEWLLP